MKRLGFFIQGQVSDRSSAVLLLIALPNWEEAIDEWVKSLSVEQD
ncbi:MAG: hypothetical protein ACM37W_11345 [Actinomycetota bacterium]